MLIKHSINCKSIPLNSQCWHIDAQTQRHYSLTLVYFCYLFICIWTLHYRRCVLWNKLLRVCTSYLTLSQHSAIVTVTYIPHSRSQTMHRHTQLKWQERKREGEMKEKIVCRIVMLIVAIYCIVKMKCAASMRHPLKGDCEEEEVNITTSTQPLRNAWCRRQQWSHSVQ